jgi:DNA-binding NarL/FixJ family response regulator
MPHAADGNYMSMRVLIVDDHPLMRTGIRALLERTLQQPEIFEAANGREALEIAARVQPDIVLLDVSMPELNGVDAARRFSTDLPSCKVIMLSMHCHEERIAQCLRAGAMGYVLKDGAVSELVDAVESVQRGEVYISKHMPAVVTTLLARKSDVTSPLELLSARQREILQMIAEGQSTKEIGYQLNLSGKTVETHRRLLMQRLSIYDVAGLARFAVRTGLVSLER